MHQQYNVSKKKSATEDITNTLAYVVVFGLISFFIIIILDISTGQNKFTDESLELNFSWWNNIIRKNWIFFTLLLVVVLWQNFMEWIAIITGNEKGWKRFKNTVSRSSEIDRLGDARPETKAFIERWTIRHFIGSGIMAFFIPGLTLAFFIGSIMFELVERTSSREGMIWFYRKEPIWNQIFDIIANVLGYITGTYLSGLMGDPLSIL